MDVVNFQRQIVEEIFMQSLSGIYCYLSGVCVIKEVIEN